jgi:2'-5' RNA ligase
MRTFLALEIPRPDREKILRIIAKFKDRHLPIKWVEFENLHITVKFLGEIDDEKRTAIAARLKEFCGLFPSFKACLSGLGCFPGPRNPRVLWVGVNLGEDKLRLLVHDLENLLAKLGVREEDKPFHPHLTFGRVKAFCKVEDILAQEFSGEPFSADSLTFFQSQLRPEGPVYDVLEKFKLG